MFCTDTQDYTLNVRDFGAKGDGVQDDTTYIQAAIMSCPRNSRVLIPEGTYRVTSLFLKDHLTMELAKGAVLSAYTERERFSILRELTRVRIRKTNMFSEPGKEKPRICLPES